MTEADWECEARIMEQEAERLAEAKIGELKKLGKALGVEL